MKDKKEKKKTKFNLAFDNLAIPEVHTGQDETADSSITPDGASDDAAVTDDVFMDCDESKEHEVSYEGVAIPEVHIGKRRR